MRAVRLGNSLSITLTLAIGVAALTATFGVAYAAFFREPPFPEAARLAIVSLERNPKGEPPRQERWSYPRFEQLRRAQTSFEDVALYSPSSVAVSDGASADQVGAEAVSASYFTLLRVDAAVGRLFVAADDDKANPAQVAALGHDLWTRRFGSDRGLVGRALRINGVPVTIVGIVPSGFRGLSGQADIFVPVAMAPRVVYGGFLTSDENFISAFGRLVPGLKLEDARSELALLGQRINRALPSDPDSPDELVTASVQTLNQARTAPGVKRSLLVLMSAVGLLHLLACANVTNLLLGRAASKRKDSAVRLALGSSGERLFRHILGDGLSVALPGGVLGIGLAALAGKVLFPPANLWAPRNLQGDLAPFDAPAVGPAELLFGALLALSTAFFVALLPALTAFRLEVSSGLRGFASDGLSLRRPSARGVIVGFEAALAMLLAVAAGLLVESYERMRNAEIGVSEARVLTFRVEPSEARVTPSSAPAFVTRLLDSIRAVPGVVSATVDGGAPLSGTARSTLYVAGRAAPAPGQAPPVLRHYVGPDHFGTLGIPLRLGRAFLPSDAEGAPLVTVISETAARRFWPGEDPLGQRVWFGSPGSASSLERSAVVVGVVGDVVYEPLERRPNFASFYTPYAQFTYASRTVFVKTAGDPLSVVTGVRAAVAAVDPELAMQDVQPLRDLVSGSWARSRFDALLFSGFGGAALLLAASGVFAVLSYAVATRSREFGVRLALGATTGRVLGHVLREGMVFPVIGMSLGALLSLLATRLLQASLYEVSPREPRVLVGTALLFLAVSACACLAPAWRAARTNPMEALRAE